MTRSKRLFKLGDAGGTLSLGVVKEKEPIGTAGLNGNDVFVLDAGKAVWVWKVQEQVGLTG